MFDEEERHAAVPEVLDYLEDFLGHGGIHPRDRLVEKDELWLRHDRARELEEFLLPPAQIFRVLVSKAQQPDDAKDLFRPHNHLGFRRRDVSQPENEVTEVFPCDPR